MEQQDGEQAAEYDMPEENKEKIPEKHEKARTLSVHSMDSGTVPVIIPTKVDLCDDLQAIRFEIENVAVGVPVMETSGLTGDNLQQIKPYLQETKIVALA